MNHLIDILKGMVIGIANIIPGVSGGTMMVSMGIYDKIISSVTGLFKHLRESILTLLPYGIGMVIGIVGPAFIIKYLFAHYAFATSMAFIGLIMGGIPIIIKRISGKRLCTKNVIAFLVMFLVIIGLKFFGGSGSEVSLTSINPLLVIELFFVGVIAAATMVIPGVSGSMVLMLLGFYNPVLTAVTDFVSALAAFDMTILIHNIGILMPFGIGVIIGIFAVAKLIELLIKKQECMTFSGILGLIIASPIVVLLEIDLQHGLGIATILSGIITFILGYCAAYMLSEK